MVKLNKNKIKWIISKNEQGWSSKRIALAQKISSSRVRQIVGLYKRTGKIPILRKPGRKAKTIYPEIINTILETHKRTNLGPLALEKKIEKERKIHIPHNTIYRVMKEFKLIKPNPNKRKQRKYVRWEGKHILARVKHPQTNGKIERWFGLIEQKFYLFDYDIDKFVKWYNEIKPHMSLWFDYAETPKEAFYRKLKPEVLIGMFFSSK